MDCSLNQFKMVVERMKLTVLGNRLLILLMIGGGCNITNAAQEMAWPEPAVPLPVFKADTFDIRDFGASDAPGVLNTESIQSAIAACHENGGGVVSIPKGVWISGPLQIGRASGRERVCPCV